MAKKITTMSPQERIQSHEDSVRESLSKYGLRQVLTVHFPRHQKVPRLGRFGVWLVNKTGGIIVTQYGIDNATINSNSRQKEQ